jgi:hypothetical protein
MGIEDKDSWLMRTYYALPRTPLRRWSRGAIVVLLVIPALVFVLILVLSAIADDTPDPPRASAGEVAMQLERAGLGCDDAHPNPEPEGGATDSVVCTLATGFELTIDSFEDEDALRAFEQRSWEYACEAYPQAVGEGGDPEALEELPYLEGRWWTAVLSIELDDAGTPRLGPETYFPLAQATQSAVVLIDC